MITEEAFVNMVLSFPGAEQKPHFERQAFKVIGKRIFATYLPKNNTANVFLSVKEQAVFCEMDKNNIYAVPNKWGDKGATTFDLNHVTKELIMEALLSAYNSVVNTKK